jgi:hypothetical protein
MNDLEIAKQKFTSSNYTFVLINRDKIITSKARGIKPIFEAVTNNKDITNGSALADKVIGKAAALLAVYGGVKNIYAQLTTYSAIEVCDKNNIYIEYNSVVSAIQNRDKTGICPMEKLSKDTIIPEEIVERVSQFLVEK